MRFPSSNSRLRLAAVDQGTHPRMLSSKSTGKPCCRNSSEVIGPIEPTTIRAKARKQRFLRVHFLGDAQEMNDLYRRREKSDVLLLGPPLDRGAKGARYHRVAPDQIGTRATEAPLRKPSEQLRIRRAVFLNRNPPPTQRKSSDRSSRLEHFAPRIRLGRRKARWYPHSASAATGLGPRAMTVTAAARHPLLPRIYRLGQPRQRARPHTSQKNDHVETAIDKRAGKIQGFAISDSRAASCIDGATIAWPP